MASMFKSNQLETPNPLPAHDGSFHALGVVHPEPVVRGNSGTEQAYIGKDLVFHGEITGTESLVIDGRIEGAVNLPGSRVTISRNGQVNANISAREIVVLGKVRGDVSAADRVDIRAEGSLTGDVTAARISIEDGAFFKGGIDIRKVDIKSVRPITVQDITEEKELKEA